MKQQRTCEYELSVILVLGILTVTGLTIPSFTLDTFASPGTGTLYGTDPFSDNLITINPSTGVPSIVGDIEFIGPSLTVDPATGIMYASSFGPNLKNLYTVNPSTGAETLVGSLVNALNAPGLDFRSDSVLYATANTLGGEFGGTSLATINPSTGLLTIIGSLGVSNMGAIAFDQNDILYGATENKAVAPFGALYTINTTTGAATLVTEIRSSLNIPHTGGFSSIQFGCDETLYYGGGSFAGDFGTINIDTGVFTQINSLTSDGSLGGLAFQLGCAPPPPPCSPPVSGDWTVSATCTMTGDATANGNVIVPNGVVLTIPNDVTLDINFATKNLTVQAGGGVLIQAGGKIT